MTTDTVAKESKLGCLPILGIVLVTMFVTAAATIWLINNQLFANTFVPVKLSNEEEQVLEAKLEKIGVQAEAATSADADQPLKQTAALDDDAPELYSEDPSKRRIALTERELNALLAKGTDLAERLVIDLSDDIASAKLLIDLDPEFPFVGGKTLKVSAGAELAYTDNRPIVVLKGVSVWGVPIPNAWLGGLKNVDLISEFGSQDGFWKAFADGIKNISVEEGHLLIELNE
ncbi:MAG: arginine N-succinyltransferase [Geminicoccaceae bacterium]